MKQDRTGRVRWSAVLGWLAKQRWAPVNSYGQCIGLTLWRLGRHKLELWWAPSNFSTPEHIHEHSDGEFFVIYGSGRKIWRRISMPGRNYVEGYDIADRKYWKWFSVRAGTPHAFSCGRTPMVWLCSETWKPGTKVTSVAEDFILS